MFPLLRKELSLKKEINLIPAKKSLDLRKYLPFIAIPAGVLLLAGIFMFAGHLQRNWIRGAQTELARLRQETSSYGYADANVKSLESMKTDLQKRKDAILKAENEKIKIVPLLDALRANVPSSIKITDFTLSNGTDVSISFETTNTYDIAELIVNLDSMGVFEDIDTGPLPIDDKTNTVTMKMKLKTSSTKEPAK